LISGIVYVLGCPLFFCDSVILSYCFKQRSRIFCDDSFLKKAIITYAWSPVSELYEQVREYVFVLICKCTTHTFYIWRNGHYFRKCLFDHFYSSKHSWNNNHKNVAVYSNVSVMIFVVTVKCLFDLFYSSKHSWNNNHKNVAVYSNVSVMIFVGIVTYLIFFLISKITQDSYIAHNECQSLVLCLNQGTTTTNIFEKNSDRFLTFETVVISCRIKTHSIFKKSASIANRAKFNNNVICVQLM
jgi:hypothetical protein